jgi:hypothetical protein
MSWGDDNGDRRAGARAVHCGRAPFSWSTSKAQARPKPVAESQIGPGRGDPNPGETGSFEVLFWCNVGRMSKWVRRGFDPGEISTSYAHFFSRLAGYDKRGVNPLGSKTRASWVSFGGSRDSSEGALEHEKTNFMLAVGTAGVLIVPLVLGGTTRSGIVAFSRGARPHLWDKSPSCFRRCPSSSE